MNFMEIFFGCFTTSSFGVVVVTEHFWISFFLQGTQRLQEESREDDISYLVLDPPSLNVVFIRIHRWRLCQSVSWATQTFRHLMTFATVSACWKIIKKERRKTFGWFTAPYHTAHTSIRLTDSSRQFSEAQRQSTRSVEMEFLIF